MMKWPFSYPVTGNERLFAFSKANKKAETLRFCLLIYLRATRMAAIMPGDFQTDWPLSDTSLLLS